MNTLFTYRGYAVNSAGTGYSPDATFWTLANAPSAPTVDNPTPSTLDVAITSGDGNPSGTTYAIQETTSGNYVQANGSLGASAVFQTAVTWGTKTVTGLNASTTYTFKVKAQNGGGTETVFSTTTSGTTSASVCTPPTFSSTSLVNVTCNGGSDGSITVNGITGGSGSGYQYSKDNGANWQVSNQFSGLSAGTYQIRVKDSIACVSPATAVTLTQPAAITFTPAQVNVTCNGGSDGSIKVNSVSGGSGSDFTYSKDNGATFQAGNQFTGLSAATYQITVKDGNSCVSSATAVTITQPAVVTINPTSPLPGGTTGTAYSQTFTGSGGSGAGYTFSVTAGSLPPGLTLTSGTLSGTPTTPNAYSFTITATDNAGCTGSRAYSLTITLPATAIAAQGFETSGDTWNYTASGLGGSASIATGSGDTPASQRILAGTHSWQVNNSGDNIPSVLTFNSVATTPYSSVSVTVRLSSTSGSTGNGADAGDQVKVFVALNGAAFSPTTDITLSGANNARYGYDATLTASTPAGTALSVTATSGSSTANYSTLKVIVPDGTTSVALKIEADNSDANEFWNFDSITLTGTPTCSAPTITTQPTDQTVCSGQQAQFSVATSASSPSYQWRKNAVNLSNAGHYSGVTTATLTINPADSADAAVAGAGYDCVVSVAGGCSTTSERHALNVNPLPTTSAISGSTLVQAGQSGVSYSVTLTSGSSYAWTVPSGASISAGSSGPNNNSITVTFGTNSGNVTVTETSAAGCAGAPATLAVTVNRPPVGGSHAVTTRTNSPISLSINKLKLGDSDPDGNTLSITAVANALPAGASVSLGSTTITYTPPADYNGSGSFQYTLSDGQGGTATVTVSVTIPDPTAGGTSGNSVFVGTQGNDFVVRFAGVPGRIYTVEHAAFAIGPWSKKENKTAPTDNSLGFGIGVFEVREDMGASPSGFYRTVYPSY